MVIQPYLKLMVDQSASDLYFTSDSPVMIRVQGRMVPVGKTVLTPNAIRDAAHGIMTEEQKDFFQSNLEIDFAIAEAGMGRFRINAFHQRGEPAMVLRFINAQIPSIDDLGLPQVLRDLIMEKRGLVLMVGATGSGKSTSLAAMIDYRNENQSGHILTIEDPIEFTYKNKQSIVNQREVGTDTHAHGAALRSALREAPDVILVGEIRERSTMQAGIELAGSGHLTLATLHASNAHQALDRIVTMFPEEMQKLLLLDMSINLKAILSQRLIPTVEGKRCAAVEVMVNTPHISELIRDGRVDDIGEAMEKSSAKGMQTFDTALLSLFKSGKITKEEALKNADSRTNLEARINFG